MIMKTVASSKAGLKERPGFGARGSNILRELHGELNALLEEEHQIIQQIDGGERLYAYFTHGEPGVFGGCW